MTKKEKSKLLNFYSDTVKNYQIASEKLKSMEKNANNELYYEHLQSTCDWYFEELVVIKRLCNILNVDLPNLIK